MQRCVRTLLIVWLIAGLTAFAGSGDSGPQVELLYRVGRDHAGHCPVEEVREILAKRVTAYGCRRATVAVQGNDHVLVRLSARDPATLRLLRSAIESVGHLEFRLVADPKSRPAEQWAESGMAEAPPGYTTYAIPTPAAGAAVSQKVLVSDRAEMTGACIRSTRVIPAGKGGGACPCVGLSFTPAGEQMFARVTGENVGKRLAIILNTRRDADGKIAKKGICYSAPTIRSRLFGDAVIEGGFSEQEAKALRTVLMAGALPAPVVLERQTPVEP